MTHSDKAPTAEQLAMARRICAEHDHNKAYQYLNGSRDDYPTMKIALAAIIETTEAAAKWAEEVYGSGKPDESTDGDCIAFDLREGAHLINGKAPKS